MIQWHILASSEFKPCKMNECDVYHLQAEALRVRAWYVRFPSPAWVVLEVRVVRGRPQSTSLFNFGIHIPLPIVSLHNLHFIHPLSIGVVFNCRITKFILTDMC